MKAIKIIATYFETNAGGVAEAVVTAGQVLPADNAIAQRQLARGNAEELDVPDDADKAVQAAEIAQAAADKAAAKAEAAAAAADAATAVAAASEPAAQ